MKMVFKQTLWAYKEAGKQSWVQGESMSMARGGQHCNTWREEHVGEKPSLVGVVLRLFDRLMVGLFWCKPEPTKFPSPLLTPCMFWCSFGGQVVAFSSCALLPREHPREEEEDGAVPECRQAELAVLHSLSPVPGRLGGPSPLPEMKDHRVTSCKSMKYH